MSAIRGRRVGLPNDVPSGSNSDPEISLTELQIDLKNLLSNLSEREQVVISMRFGLADGVPKTLDEIAKVCGVTRERIRGIITKALGRLNHPVMMKLLERDYADLPTIQ